jgi:putative oxidoreductase
VAQEESMLGKRFRVKKRASLTDAATLVLRLTLGGLLAGHGAQKLFGWFGGEGFDKVAEWLGSIGLRPARTWTALAGLSELGGGALTALGFLHPLGQLGVFGAMGMATAKVHWGKPIWVNRDGAELPVTNMAIATSLMLTGPGRFSLDEILGTKIPRWVALPGLAAVGAGIAIGLLAGAERPEVEAKAKAGAELPAGRQVARPT